MYTFTNIRIPFKRWNEMVYLILYYDHQNNST